MDITTSSLSIRSAMSISSYTFSIWVRRGVSYFCFISRSSLFIISSTLCGLAKISVKSSILATSSLYSFLSVSTSNAVRRDNFISKIAFVCSSLNKNLSFNFIEASVRSLLLFIVSITSSILACATSKPSTI